MFSKNQFRKEMISKFHLMSDSEKMHKSKLIFSSLQNLIKNFAGSWGCFQSLNTEPQIEFKEIKDINWCYPKTSVHQLHFYSGAKAFENSNLQVLEPIDGTKIELDHMTGVCVPGLAFHSEGYRLGRGKGFYDQTFAHFLGTKIGLCYDFGVSKEVPFESHDLKMDYIITDLQVIHTGEK